MITFLEECELKVFPYPYHKKKKKNKGSEMFTDSMQITKLLSSWNRYCTLVWLHHIPDSFHFALLSLQPPFPGVHPHLICTFQRAEQATYIFLFQNSNFLLDLTQRSISLSETSFVSHSNHFQKEIQNLRLYTHCVYPPQSPRKWPTTI